MYGNKTAFINLNDLLVCEPNVYYDFGSSIKAQYAK